MIRISSVTKKKSEVKAFAMCRAFGKETGFCVAAFFVPTIISAIIAFGSSEYMEDVIEIIPEY